MSGARFQSLRIMRSLLAGLLAIAFLARGVQAEPRSIQEFLTYKPKWNEFVLTSYTWNLEGRYAVIGDGAMQFTNCPLSFVVSKEVARNRGTSGVVEVTGKLVNEDKKLVFRVEQMTPRPSDMETVRLKRYQIDSTEPKEWYRVADWARQRGEFYDDRELKEAARDLDRNGVLTDFRRLNPLDEQALTDLVRLAREKHVEEDLVQQILHESLRSRLANIRSKPFSDASYRDLLVKLNQELRGCTTPLETFPQQLYQDYESNAKQVYASANAAQREKLHRLFYADVMTARILHDAREDGSNGFELADRFRADVPERTDLIQRYDDMAVKWQMQRLDVMPRDQLLDLTRRLDRMGRNEAAVEAKRGWLISRESLYRKDGARGLVDLANQWLDLLNDKDAAVQLYIDAWRANPQYSPASDWLTAQGYRQVNDGWFPASAMPAPIETPVQVAIREGRVERGMTSAQVRAALGGEPASITRMASSTQINEWWIYEDAGVVVQLARQIRDPERIVVGVARFQPAVTAPKDE